LPQLHNSKKIVHNNESQNKQDESDSKLSGKKRAFRGVSPSGDESPLRENKRPRTSVNQSSLMVTRGARKREWEEQVARARDAKIRSKQKKKEAASAGGHSFQILSSTIPSLSYCGKSGAGIEMQALAELLAAVQEKFRNSDPAYHNKDPNSNPSCPASDDPLKRVGSKWMKHKGGLELKKWLERAELAQQIAQTAQQVSTSLVNYANKTHQFVEANIDETTWKFDISNWKNSDVDVMLDNMLAKNLQS